MNILTLAGIAAFLAVLIEIAKKLGYVPDGYAGWLAVIANVIVFVIAIVAGYLEFDLTDIDAMFMALAKLLGELFLSVAVSLATHKGGRAMQIW